MLLRIYLLLLSILFYSSILLFSVFLYFFGLFVFFFFSFVLFYGELVAFDMKRYDTIRLSYKEETRTTTITTIEWHLIYCRVGGWKWERKRIWAIFFLLLILRLILSPLFPSLAPVILSPFPTPLTLYPFTYNRLKPNWIVGRKCFHFCVQ